MLGQEAKQKLAVKPVDVAHQLLKLEAAAIDAEINARVAELRMVVDEQDLFAIVLHEVGRQMHGERGRADAALGSEEGDHRAADAGACA